jgi:HD-GYP domain-containing protein (c-di-GMP phosphodiesterase class II)
MLVRQGGFDADVLQIVRNHHEFLDGSGYPDRLDGARIPDLAVIHRSVHERLAGIA